jgi:uncharacterized protein YdgA (DUF945 family)
MNRAGKIAALVVAVLVVMFFGLTWLTGQLSKARMDEFFAKAGQPLQGQIKFVDRKSSTGFFQSTEDVTMEIENPAYRAMLNQMGRPQLTFRNVISHGPLPGFRRFAIAHVETTLLLSEDERQALQELMGTDKPLNIQLTLGWTGKTRIDVTSPVMTMKSESGDSGFEWRGLTARIDFARNFKGVEFDATAPGFKASLSNGDVIDVSTVKATGKLQNKFETLYVGDEDISVEGIQMSSAAKPELEIPASTMDIGKVTYRVIMTADNEFWNMDNKLTAASFANSTLSLEDIHFDFAMNHLHGVSMAKLLQITQAYTAKVEAQVAALSPAEGAEAPAAEAIPLEPVVPPMEEMTPHLSTLFSQKPEIVVSNIGFANKGGALKFSGRLALENVTAADFEPTFNPGALIGKMAASGDVVIPKALVDNMGEAGTNFLQMAEQYEAQGFLIRKADEWTAHLEFIAGKMVVNGVAR